MQWLTLHADALSSIGIICGFLYWLKCHTDKKFSEMKEDLSEIKKDVKSIDQRLTKLEGRFEERGYWESRIVIRKEREERQPETIPTISLTQPTRRRTRRKPSNTNEVT